MDRRKLLKYIAATPGIGSGRPEIAGNDAGVLRFVPQGGLKHPDPLVTIAPNACNSGHMIWDSLYGQTIGGGVRPEMVAGHEVSADGRTWRFTLRDGLLFHDNEPVRAADCVASFNRWAKRRAIGQKLLDELDQIRVFDDRRFEIATKRPFPRMITMLGRDTFFFVMPERIANTPPLQQILEFVGSGPYRFVTDEWQPGARAAFTRFEKYSPRGEPADFLSGGKRVAFDRVEWVTLTDPATAAAALQRGGSGLGATPAAGPAHFAAPRSGREAHGKRPVRVHVDAVVQSPPAAVRQSKVVARAAAAIDQTTFMQAAVGDDPALAHTGIGFFTPGLGMDSSAGLEALTGPRDIAAARKLVGESGYSGEKVVVLSPTNIPEQQAICEVTLDLFTRIGLNVEYVGLDQGALEKRRLSREPVDKGGRSIVAITFDGLSAADPSSHQAIRGNGAKAFFGWPTSPELETLRDQWFLAEDQSSQKKICAEMPRIAWRQIPFMPLGHWFAPMAIRDNLRDVVTAPFPIFWNVRRA
jgi:peptide/nickel transport system substrate-binding protein